MLLPGTCNYAYIDMNIIKTVHVYKLLWIQSMYITSTLQITRRNKQEKSANTHMM